MLDVAADTPHEYPENQRESPKTLERNSEGIEIAFTPAELHRDVSEEFKKSDVLAKGAKETPEKISPEKLSDAPESASKESGCLFLEVTHVPSVAKVVAQELKQAKCDRVAIEILGYATPNERKEVEEKYTSLISSERLKEIQQDPAGKIAQETRLLFAKRSFDIALFSELMGTDMKVTILDATKKDPEYALADASDAADMHFFMGLLHHAPNNELRKLLRTSLEALSASNAARETYMTAQLRALRMEYPEEKIGVITGASHTPISHTLAKTERIERKFITPVMPYRRNVVEKLRYPAAAQLQRELRLLPDKEFNEALLDRALLESMLLHFLSQVRKSLAVRLELAVRCTDRLSNNEVAAVLDEIDAIKKKPHRLYGQRRTFSAIEQLFLKISDNNTS
jgi:hypothetical protein